MPHVSRLLEPAVVERLNQLSLSARRVVEGNTAGLHRSPLKGASIEFRQHRAYTPGDEPRRLDWRVLGRTDRPYIKEYDEETNLRCILMLDRSGSMGYGGRGATKFDYASRLVASLAYLMLARTESVGLAVYGAKVDPWLAPHAVSTQLSHVIDVLERAAPKGKSNPQRAMRDVADRLGRRALVIVVSDFLTPVAEIHAGLARLHHDRHELILLQVLDADEETFPFRSVSRFRGMEGEAPRLCETGLVRKTYLKNLARHREDLERACRRVGGEFAVFRTDRPMIDALIGFLTHRAGQK
jgi:uncharacterized protein (DUF58 family)